MSQFRVTYRPELDRQPELIEAESVEIEGDQGMVVLRQTVLVMGRPRLVVVRRLSGRDVLEVSESQP